MFCGEPSICIKHTGTPSSAAASNAPSRRKANTSLMKLAPAATAARITSGFEVSMLIGTLVCLASASITGITRNNSSSTETGFAFGRVDSPPISKICAPCSTKRSACSTACCLKTSCPPSENESGVTLIIAMIFGVSSFSEYFPHCKLGMVSNMCVGSVCIRNMVTHKKSRKRIRLFSLARPH